MFAFTNIEFLSPLQACQSVTQPYKKLIWEDSFMWWLEFCSFCILSFSDSYALSFLSANQEM